MKEILKKIKGGDKPGPGDNGDIPGGAAPGEAEKGESGQGEPAEQGDAGEVGEQGEGVGGEESFQQHCSETGISYARLQPTPHKKGGPAPASTYWATFRPYLSFVF